ncbi:sugar ABC transporter ATP-binding protein [Herbiconiux ginsengi]|uniref:sugar ABC transporter ATP-binding protein n=1 Tax=Herbiconiux ginsengi TaxID=381665 RepID=UPI001587F161|nr:sugar ABC transporter ATP-binding protein [Herbiconiux ginsengi]
MREISLLVSGARKSYNGTPALRGVDLAVARGTIHALAGGNGSGKSTLIKLLAAVESADDGTVEVDGAAEQLHRLTPSGSHGLGLRFVHQNPGIFDDLTVAENFGLTLGFPRRLAGIRWSRLNKRVAENLERFEVDARPTQRAGDLRPATKTMVAIARALSDPDDADAASHRVLVLDEPTASLPSHEVDILLEALRRRADAGQTILYVSHRLGELRSLASDITVLRDGLVVAARPLAALSEHEIVELMAGEPLEEFYPVVPQRSGVEQPALSVAGLSTGPLLDVELTVRRGEILGVAGLLGSGRSTLLRSLFGDAPAEAIVEVGGEPVERWSLEEAMSRGVGFIPEDRGQDALFATMSVRENSTIANLPAFVAGGRLRRRKELSEYESQAGKLRIKSASPELPITALSGGNQQKVVLTRWLQRSPGTILLDEPTQGVDAMARAEIYSELRTIAANGTAVVIASSDFEELSNLCDRVVVLRDGRIVAELAHAEASIPALVSHCYASQEGRP